MPPLTTQAASNLLRFASASHLSVPLIKLVALIWPSLPNPTPTTPQGENDVFVFRSALRLVRSPQLIHSCILHLTSQNPKFASAAAAVSHALSQPTLDPVISHSSASTHAKVRLAVSKFSAALGALSDHLRNAGDKKYLIEFLHNLSRPSIDLNTLVSATLGPFQLPHLVPRLSTVKLTPTKIQGFTSYDTTPQERKRLLQVVIRAYPLCESDLSLVDTFEHSALLLRAVQAPCILTIHGIHWPGTADNPTALVITEVHGIDLISARTHPSISSFNVREDLLLDILSAVAALSKNSLHHPTLSPSSVVLNIPNDTLHGRPCAKLDPIPILDWSVFQHSTLDLPLSELIYLAPEVSPLTGGTVSSRVLTSNTWSAGLIACFMLADCPDMNMLVQTLVKEGHLVLASKWLDRVPIRGIRDMLRPCFSADPNLRPSAEHIYRSFHNYIQLSRSTTATQQNHVASRLESAASSVPISTPSISTLGDTPLLSMERRPVAECTFNDVFSTPGLQTVQSSGSHIASQAATPSAQTSSRNISSSWLRKAVRPSAAGTATEKSRSTPTSTKCSNPQSQQDGNMLESNIMYETPCPVPPSRQVREIDTPGASGSASRTPAQQSRRPVLPIVTQRPLIQACQRMKPLLTASNSVGIAERSVQLVPPTKTQPPSSQQHELVKSSKQSPTSKNTVEHPHPVVPSIASPLPTVRPEVRPSSSESKLNGSLGQSQPAAHPPATGQMSTLKPLTSSSDINPGQQIACPPKQTRFVFGENRQEMKPFLHVASSEIIAERHSQPACSAASNPETAPKQKAESPSILGTTHKGPHPSNASSAKSSTSQLKSIIKPSPLNFDIEGSKPIALPKFNNLPSEERDIAKPSISNACAQQEEHSSHVAAVGASHVADVSPLESVAIGVDLTGGFTSGSSRKRKRSNCSSESDFEPDDDDHPTFKASKIGTRGDTVSDACVSEKPNVGPQLRSSKRRRKLKNNAVILDVSSSDPDVSVKGDDGIVGSDEPTNSRVEVHFPIPGDECTSKQIDAVAMSSKSSQAHVKRRRRSSKKQTSLDDNSDLDSTIKEEDDSKAQSSLPNDGYNYLFDDAMTALKKAVRSDLPQTRNNADFTRSLVEAAKRGDRNALVSFGLCVLTGTNFKADVQRGSNMLFEASKSCDPRAQYYAGLCFEDGIGVMRNENEAVKLFRSASKGGHLLGKFRYAIMLMTGRGTKLNLKEASKLFAEADAKGHLPSKVKLASCYIKDSKVSRHKDAIKLYRTAMDLGNAEAMLAMGLLHEDGVAVKKDPARSLTLYMDSSAAGYGPAHTALGQCYSAGYQVQENKQKAFDYFELATQEGHDLGMYELGMMYRHGIFMKRDDAKAAELFQKASDKRLAVAMVQLGECLYYGQGLDQDIGKAVQLFQKAADFGVAEGFRWLGECYVDGTGVEKDMKKAIRHLRRATEKGSATAHNSLGKFYEIGDGVPVCLKSAFKHFTKASEAKDPTATSNLGMFYEHGKYVPQDFKKAAELYKQAIELGSTEAMCHLGDCYASGRGVEKNLETAVHWYSQGDKNGMSGAQFELGMCYYVGRGVVRNLKLALQYFRKAEEEPEALRMLGNAYYEGQGVTQNFEKAFELFGRAFEGENADAAVDLGRCYLAGHGVDRDTKKAVDLFTKAACDGNKMAMLEIGNMYHLGIGVSKDYKIAVKWLLQGHGESVPAAEPDTNEDQQRVIRSSSREAVTCE